MLFASCAAVFLGRKISGDGRLSAALGEIGRIGGGLPMAALGRPKQGSVRGDATALVATPISSRGNRSDGTAVAKELNAWHGVFDRLGVPDRCQRADRKTSERQWNVVPAEFLASGLVDEGCSYKSIAAELGVAFSPTVQPADIATGERECLKVLRRQRARLQSGCMARRSDAEIASRDGPASAPSDEAVPARQPGHARTFSRGSAWRHARGAARQMPGGADAQRDQRSVRGATGTVGAANRHVMARFHAWIAERGRARCCSCCFPHSPGSACTWRCPSSSWPASGFAWRRLRRQRQIALLRLTVFPPTNCRPIRCSSRSTRRPRSSRNCSSPWDRSCGRAASSRSSSSARPTTARRSRLCGRSR